MVEKAIIDIREIIKKTGHSLEEIRIRALENILSKLRNGIIFSEDLIHHRELIINLLQWFNHENPPKIREVLGLLANLAKHGSAVSIMQSLGGVEFFSTLRQDLTDPELLELVDNILDSIFWIHVGEEQLYADRNDATEGTSSAGLSKLLQKPVGKQEVPMKHSHSPQDASLSKSKQGPQYSKANFSTNEKPTLNQDNNKSADTNLTNASPQDFGTSVADEGGAVGQQSFTAEWIVLTSSDRHILSVTESRLQSHSMDLVLQSCEFFRDVLLQDFPTQIFIQRPNIVKILLSLLDMYAQKENDITTSLIGCLNEITVKLAKSSLQQASPNLSQTSKVKETYSSTASSVHTELSSLHSRTTSFNGEGTSMHSGNTLERDLQSNVETDPEDFEGAILTEALQQSQWSAIDFCFHLTSNIISYINQAIEGKCKCEDAVILLNNVLNLLRLYDVKSCWALEIGEKKVYDVMTCLRHFGSLIQLSLDTKERTISQSWSDLDVETSFALLGNMTAISIRFINLTVPYDKIYEAVPENLLSSYKAIFADEVFAQIYPSIRFSLHSIMKAAEEEFYHHFQNAITVVSSMKATVSFLQEVANKEASTRKALSKRINLCDISLLSVGFHQHEIFIRSSLNLISSLFSFKDPPADLTSKAMDILLRLLSHKNDQVRLIAYEYCLDIISGALSESHVTNPLSSAYQRALFLIHSDVFKEIISFGLESTNKRIADFAVNILVTLLLGRLNMTSEAWQNVIFSLIPVLPLLQCFAGVDKALGRALTNMSDSSNALLASDGKSYSLPPLEHIRASFRFMFVKDDSIRAKGFSSLIWTLSQEDSKAGNPIRYPHEAIENASDMFLVSPTTSCKYQKGDMEHSGFNGSNLDQLWNVFDSAIVDESLRESAAEQLSVLVQDASLHKQLLEHDADKSILKAINERVNKVNFYSSTSLEKHLKMIQSCITMLRYLVQYNARLRHTLAVNRNLFLDILRCRIAYNDNELIHFEASCLILFLAFDEMFGKNGNELTLPFLIAKRYVLPLHLKTHEVTTPHRQKRSNVNAEDFNTLEEEPLNSMIRVSWNVILETKSSAQDTKQPASSEALPLTSVELKLIKDLSAHSAMKRHLSLLKNSESASKVVTAIKDLNKHLSSCVCKLNTSVVFEDFSQYIQTEKVLNRLLAVIATKNKTSHLHAITTFCQMITSAESKTKSSVTKDILMILLETKGPLSAAVSDYTTIRAQQADLQRGEKETYDLTNESRSLFKSILLLVSSLCIKINSDEDIVDYTGFAGIGDLIFLILQTLNRVDSTRYYDLPVLESTLECLSHLTYKRGWSVEYSGSGEDLCNIMANIFIQVLYSFHVDRMGASTSFMGKGVIAKAAMGLCHVAMENQAYCGSKDWTVNWVSRNLQQADEDIDHDLPWLLPLLTDRILDIRWCGWSLSTALLNGSVGAESVVNEFQVFPGGVWASAVGVILDEFENPLVRTQACRLISISLSKLKQSGKQSANQNLWESMVVQDSHTQENISGVPAFLLLLDHFHFFSKIKEHLMQQVSKSTHVSSSTSYHNVSTSCSTPATDIEPAYESISNDSNDTTTTERSAVNSRAGSETGLSVGGSSSERHLLSSADSLYSEHSQMQYTFNRFPAQNPLTATHKNEKSRFQYPTPMLKAAFFQLISKLLETDADSVIVSLETEGFLNILMRSLDPHLIVSYFTKSSEQMSSFTVQTFRENADMITKLLKLINLITIHHKEAYTKLDDDPHFCNNLIALFRLPDGFMSSSTSINNGTFSLWNEALRLLIKIIIGRKNVTKSNAETEVFKCFDVMTVSYAYSASMKKAAQTTSDLFLAFFKAIFCREGKRPLPEKTLSEILDTPCLSLNVFKKEIKQVTQSTSPHLTLGEYLSNLLMNQLNTFHVAALGRRTVVSSLSCLFAVSTTSKLTADETGFLESVIEDIKDIHVKLNLASLQMNKDDNQNKRGKVLLVELACTFDLLRNLFHANAEVKDAAAKSGLLAAIQKMWSWCMIDKSLKLSMLELLATITSQCTKAQEFICHSGAASNRPIHDENTLFHSIIKLAVKLHKDSMAPTGKIENSLRISFFLLANLAVFSECRSLIWKCNFLQHFKSSQVGQSANKKQKVASKILTALWIQFILVLSFFADGTNAILKVDGMLPTLIAFASEENHRERQRSLLILRNLLSFPANKPSLVTNGHLVTCLLKGIEIKSIWSKSVVISCFATLLHNCNKAKVALKRTKLLGKLQLLNQEILTGKILCIDGEMRGYEQLKLALKKTIDTLAT